MSTQLLIDHIRKELDAVVDEELARVTDEEKMLKELPERTRKRLRALIDSYKGLEQTILQLGQLNILGLTSDTAKVGEIDSSQYGSVADMVYVSISNYSPFARHPAGDRFKLEPNKKYKVLVAFLPVEEKK